MNPVQIDVDRLDPCEVRVRVQVPASDFDARARSFEPAVKGEQARAQAVQAYLQEALPLLTKEHGLRPHSAPRVDLAKALPAAGAGLEVSFGLLVRPEFELPDYAGLEVEEPFAREVTDEDVDREVEALREEYAELEPAPDTGLVEGAVAVCDLTLMSGSREVGSHRGVTLQLETEIPGVDREALRGALQGAREGALRDLDATLPDGVPKPDSRGERGKLRIAVLVVRKTVPATDEQLAARLKLDGPEGASGGVRAHARGRLEERRREWLDGQVDAAILERLLDDVDVPVPERAVGEAARQKVQAAIANVPEEHRDHPDLQRQAQELEQVERENAAREMRRGFLLGAIAEREGLGLAQADLDGEVARIAARNPGATVAEVRTFYEGNNLTQQLASEVGERKVRDFLRARAEVRVAAAPESEEA